MKKLLLLVVTAFIGFNYNVSAQSCDTLRNWNLNNPLSIISGETGYVPGHEILQGDQILRWAEPFTATTATEVRAFRFVPDEISDAGGSITLHVWEDIAGEPGNSISSQVVPIADLQAGFYNTIEFTVPANVNGSFFAGVAVEYSNYPANEVAFISQEVTTGTLKMYDNTFGWDDVSAVYNLNGAPAQLSMVLDVLTSTAPDPVAEFTFNPEICLGGTFSVDGSTSQNVDQYEWLLSDNPFDPNVIYDDAVGQTATLNPTVSGGNQAIYLVADGGCKFDVVGYIATVNAEITATVGATNTSCNLDNGTITITNPAGGTGSFAYSLDGVTYQAGNEFIDLPSGNYDVYVASTTILDGCETVYPITIQPSAPPEIITVGTDETICDGASAILTASGTGTIEWFEGTTSVGTGTSLTVSPSTTTTYEAILTDANNCEDSDVVEVTVNPQDDASFTFNNFCVGAANGPTNIVTTGGTFTFNPMPTDGATIDGTTGEISNGTLATTYTVQYETFGVCPDVTTETVTVQANDDPAFEYLLTCDGNAIVPSNIATTGGTFAFSTAPTGGESIDASTGEITGAMVGTVYSVEYTTPAGVCQSSAIEQVEIYALPIVDAGSDVTICEGDQAELLATGANTFTWDNGLGTGASQSVTPTSTTVYTVTGIDGNNCQNTDLVEVAVNPLPEVDAGANQEVCEGDEVTLEAINPDGATISWDGGVSDGVAFTPSIGANTFTATAELNGCIATDDVVVSVGAAPTVSAGNNAEACLNHEPITLTGSPAGGTFSGPGVDGTTFDPSVAGEGTHEIVYTFTDGNGCEGQDAITIIVDGCLSIEELSLGNNVLIAPNPAVTHFDIKVGTDFIINSITVLSAEGRVVKSINVNPSTETTVDVSDLSKGTYFVKIRTASEEVTKKIIVH